MTKRELTRWAIGGGIAAALCASTLPAQVDTTRRDTTRSARSTTRIPIRKSGGEVVLPSSRARTDSIALQARRDSITRADLARNDSIAAVERARMDSINMKTRADSIAQAARTDSIARAEQARTDSISRLEQMRNDSIARANAPVTPPVETQTGTMTQTVRRLPGSFYMGLAAGSASPTRSEERRVGKVCRSRGGTDAVKRTKHDMIQGTPAPTTRGGV